MTGDLNIPTTSTPARPGEAAAEGVDLRSRHQSATIDMTTGQVTIEHKGVVKADSANMGAGSPVFSRVQSRSGTIDDAGLDTIVSGPSIPGDGVRLPNSPCSFFRGGAPWAGCCGARKKGAKRKSTLLRNKLRNSCALFAMT